jgi:hypothetical protein
MWSHHPDLESIEVTGRGFADFNKHHDVASTARAPSS